MCAIRRECHRPDRAFVTVKDPRSRSQMCRSGRNKPWKPTGKMLLLQDIQDFTSRHRYKCAMIYVQRVGADGNRENLQYSCEIL
jgi:hypothetical protein